MRLTFLVSTWHVDFEGSPRQIWLVPKLSTCICTGIKKKHPQNTHGYGPLSKPTCFPKEEINMGICQLEHGCV